MSRDVWPSDVKLLLEAMESIATASGDEFAKGTLHSARKYIEQLETRLVDAGRICFVADRAGYSKKRIHREIKKAADLCMSINPVLKREPSTSQYPTQATLNA